MSKQRTNNPYINLPDAPSKGPSLFWIIVCFTISRVFGSLMVFFRLKSYWKRKQHSDYCAYASVIGHRFTVALSELASKCGKTTDTVISDLQAMIDKGIIGKGAYIDHEKMLLILDPTIFETFFVNTKSDTTAPAEPEKKQHKRDIREKVQQQASEIKKDAPAASAPKKSKGPSVYNFTGSEEYEEKLRQIHELDLAIADECVSSRIDRIGHLTANIFRIVEERPERADEVRKFMNYYLPTTFKLLKSYSLMEKQPFQGDNIAASRKKIEDILDTLVHAFEQQLDRLFHAEAMDVDADISVLETMMTSDGLIEPELSFDSMRKKAGSGKK